MINSLRTNNAKKILLNNKRIEYYDSLAFTIVLTQGVEAELNSLDIELCYMVPSSTTGATPNQLSHSHIPARMFEFDSTELYLDCFIFDETGRYMATHSDNGEVLDFSCLFGIDCSYADSSGLYGYGIRMSGLKRNSTFLKPATYEYAMTLDLEPGQYEALFVIGPTRVIPYTDINSITDWKSAFGKDIRPPLGPIDLGPNTDAEQSHGNGSQDNQGGGVPGK